MNVTITNVSLENGEHHAALLVKVTASAATLEDADTDVEALVGKVPLYFARTGACVDDDTDVILTSGDGSLFLGHTVDSLDLSDSNDMQLWIELN